MATRRLTIDLRDLTDQPAGALVEVSLSAAGDRAVPDADDPGREIIAAGLSAHGDINGQAVFDLIPTGQLAGGSQYSLRINRGAAQLFAMPDRDITWYGLQQTTPPPAATLPAAPDDGDVLYYDQEWIAHPIVSQGNTAPADPKPNDLWADTSGAAAVLRVWDGTAWIAVGGTGGGGGLTEAQVKAEIKPYAQTDQPATLIATADIANDAITRDKLADDAVGSDAIGNNAVPTDAIVDDAVTQAKLDNTVVGRLVPPGGTQGQILAKSSDTDYDDHWIPAPSGGGGLSQSQVRAEIRPFAQTSQTTRIATGDIADNAVTGAKIPSNAVIARHILADNVTQAKIAASAVGTTELANNAVTTAKIGDNQVTRPKIPANTIGDQQISDGSVTTNKLRNLGVTTGKLADDAVTAAKLAAGAVATASIGDDAVTLDKLAQAVINRLIPAGGTSGQVLKKDTATDYDVSWQADETGSGGGGLSTTQVRALIADWAEQGNTDPIPPGKLAARHYEQVQPTADVVVTSGATGGYGNWTDIAITTALSSTQTGRYTIIAHAHTQELDASGGGGDRIGVSYRLVKRPTSGADAPLGFEEHDYLRNVNAGSTTFQSDLQTSSETLADFDQATTGDRFVLQARLIAQTTSAAKTVTAAATRNHLKIVQH